MNLQSSYLDKEKSLKERISNQEIELEDLKKRIEGFDDSMKQKTNSYEKYKKELKDEINKLTETIGIKEKEYNDMTDVLKQENEKLKIENKRLNDDANSRETKIRKDLRKELKAEKIEALNEQKSKLKEEFSKICLSFNNAMDSLEVEDNSEDEDEEENLNQFKVKKMLTTWNSNKNQFEVYVACKTQYDAYNHALNHGEKGYYNTPIHNVMHQPDRDDHFNHFHLGRNNQKEYVMHQGDMYNYHYYYGSNDHGMIAREKEGCDVPDPYYY